MSQASSTSVLRQRFRILDTYRGGGPVEVYKAAQLEGEEREVALTVVTVEEPEGLAALPRIFTELRRCVHPHLPRIYEFGWLSGAQFIPVADQPLPPPDGRFYYAREWIDGALLRNQMDNDDPTARKLVDTLELAERIAVAIRALHWPGVLFLDLTPANILIPRDRTKMKVIGLESCWLLDDPFPGVGNRGTPGYTAPELFTVSGGPEGYPVSYATDIFSLAVLLFEMISDRTPFGTGLEYIGYWSELTRRAKPFRLPMQFEGSWGDGLLAAHLSWCLEGVPKRRAQTVDEFLAPVRLLRRSMQGYNFTKAR